MEEGDQTMVGERGTTLSGGQRARLSLARAIYADPDILLLDDPISAVDSKVAKKISENIVSKLKGKKTVVLVTHQISHLFGCDRVCIMKDGRIDSCDQPENLRSKLTEMETGEKSEESTEEEESSEDKIIG